MNKRHIVRLDPDERGQLEAIVSKGQASARKITHAQILLKVDAAGPKWTDEEAAGAFNVQESTVRAVRERFVFEGLESALNRKKAIRPPVEPKLDGAKEAHLIAMACSQPPDGQVRWTLRLLANRLVQTSAWRRA